MITYRDQSWCKHECGNEKCFRNYTDEEHKRNINGVNLPLSMGNFKSETCGYIKK